MLTPVLRLVLIYVLLALVVVGVFNRDKVMRLVTGQGTETVAEAPAVPVGAAEPAAPGNAAAQDTAPAAPTYAAPETAAQPQAQAVAPAPAQSTAPGQNAQLQTPVAPGTAPAVTAQPGTAPAPAPQAQPVAPTAPDAELVQAVNAARQAYWAGDLDGARSQLDALVAAHPDNPDLFGELGNLHFSTGDYPAAAQAYEQAGKLLVQQGRGSQAMALLPVLQRLDPAKAEALAEVLGLR